MNYFTADIHFADQGTMEYDYRPFRTIEQYDNYVVKTWNKTAKKGDTIYVVGDLLDFDQYAKGDDIWKRGLELTSKIKANVILIIGNNEQRIIKHCFNEDFEAFKQFCYQYGIKEVHTSLDVKIGETTCHLVHQLIHANKRKINLYGHTHLATGLYSPFGLCISTDLNHFRLYTENQILAYLERKRRFWDVDSNCNYINPHFKEIDGKMVNTLQEDSKYIKNLKKEQFKTKIK